MKKTIPNLQAVILAAGKGKRMNSKNLPKVLHSLADRPMIFYLIESLKKFGIEKPIIVIGHRAEKVKKMVGPQFSYVEQKKRLGTGHAVIAALPLLRSKWTLIVNGDNPFFRPKTFRALWHLVRGSKAVGVLVVASLPKDFPYGRIIRGSNSEVVGIVEEKDATSAQKEISEKNCGAYIFRTDFLKRNLNKLQKSRASGEYYLTDLVALAQNDHSQILAVPLQDWREAIGINTPGQLQMARKVIKKFRFNYS